MNEPTDFWIAHTRHTLERYDEALLRQVAHKLCKPRNQWPVEELLDRVSAALDNVAMIDRRLKELPAPCRQILAVISRSRQSRWPVGSLVEMLVILGAKDALGALVTLLESGLLLPELTPPGTPLPDAKLNGRSRLKSFETWIARSDPTPILVAPTLVAKRALNEDLGIECPKAKAPAGTAVHEADGMDWPLRVGVLWQQLLDAPMRRTQQGEYFKRDHDRLTADPLLSAALTDTLAPVPDPGFLAAALALPLGLIQQHGADLSAGSWPDAWKNSHLAVLQDVWTALLHARSWNPATGYTPEQLGNPYPAVYLSALLLLTRLKESAWADPAALEAWIVERHPYWSGKKPAPIGLTPFLLGVAYSLRLVQATKADDAWLVRLSPTGRWLMGLTDHPLAQQAFKQTLLVQPNLEILAYRQGLTPELIVNLTKIATWKTLGPACTLQLEPHSVYRALEMGGTLTSIVQLLEGHGMKAIPTAVLDSLKTWSSKRERIRVYSAGAIFEFATPADMNDAIARGLKAQRLTDRLAIVAREEDIDYKHFRLTGTRDYTLPPEKCVEVEGDGVTLSVDVARSDLLLDTELQRFAEPVDSSALPAVFETPGAKGPPTARRLYRITPVSIAAARQHGVSLAYLQTWFAQRTGLPITAAALLLMTGPEAPPVELRRQLVVHFANEHLADGVAQWPGTRDLVVARLGPKTLVIEESSVHTLAERLKELGIPVRTDSV